MSRLLMEFPLKFTKGISLLFWDQMVQGKSTTIKIITTLLKQDGGTFNINGKTDNNYIREKIGVVFQKMFLTIF